MSGRKKTDEASRFWEKVECKGPDECWPWTGGTHKGYGTFRETGAKRGGKTQAQRVAYRLRIGPPPIGHDVDHLCNNPLCVNPKHLEPVTHSENMKRMWTRRRALLGNKAGMCWGVKRKQSAH
jgi:HNH endonuclease